MAILVVGSVAFDSLETPHGKAERILGGAATYFSLAASYFTAVRVIAVVGEDFMPLHEEVLTKRGIDTRGIEHAPGLSFHWTGSYVDSLNEAKTLGTDLNVFADFEPKIPEAYADSEFLFLANIDPVLQARVRKQMPGVKMVCGDTMNYWIADHAANLAESADSELDVLLINDGEARKLLGGRSQPCSGGSEKRDSGPGSKVADREAWRVWRNRFLQRTYLSPDANKSSSANKPAISVPFRAPALPLADVVDPTGAGDSFAGGFFGYHRLAGAGHARQSLSAAMFYGGVMGSFAVEKLRHGASPGAEPCKR